jgi:hypothetical protein
MAGVGNGGQTVGMRRGWWPVVGLVGGVVAGAFWGWAGGDSEWTDSAIGTGFLCGLAGMLAGAVAAHLAERRDR